MRLWKKDIFSTKNHQSATFYSARKEWNSLDSYGIDWSYCSINLGNVSFIERKHYILYDNFVFRAYKNPLPESLPCMLVFGMGLSKKTKHYICNCAFETLSNFKKKCSGFCHPLGKIHGCQKIWIARFWYNLMIQNTFKFFRSWLLFQMHRDLFPYLLYISSSCHLVISKCYLKGSLCPWRICLKMEIVRVFYLYSNKYLQHIWKKKFDTTKLHKLYQLIAKLARTTS